MPRTLVKKFLWTLIIANLVYFGAVSGQDKPAVDPAPAPAKEKVKKKKPKLEDAVFRAMLKAKEEDMKIVRATVTPSDIREDGSFIIMVEFGSSDVGMFQGGLDPTEDQWVLCGSRELDMIVECMNRRGKR